MTDEQAATVWVVDDDDSLREGLLRALTDKRLQARGFESGQDFLEAFEPQEPGCVVLDLRMPGLDGLAVQRELAGRGAGVPVLLMTGDSDVGAAVEAMRLGAFDCVEKPFEHDHLVERVKAALSHGRQSFERAQRARAARERLESLTARERQVLELVASGNSNRQIAESLGISRRTVEVHRNHLMAKMGTSNVVELLHAYKDASQDG